MVLDPRLRIVTSTPLTTLWNDTGDICASRGQDLGTPDIKELLQNDNVQFVVANVGFPLEWIPPKRTFEFWAKAKPHIVENSHIGYALEDFPGEYAYGATLWVTEQDIPIVLLEMYH